MSGRAVQLCVTECAPKPLVQSVQQMLSKLSISTSVLESAKVNSVVVGSGAPQGVVAAVVEPPASPYPAYASVKTTVVRSILPRKPVGVMQLRDAVDVYHGAGIDTTAERKQAEEAFTKAAQISVEKAKKMGATNITVVIKPATKYQRLNDLFTHTVTEVIHNAGLNCDVIHTSRAANELLLFPEKFEVVLTNDDPICENVQLAFAGALGGAPSTYYTLAGEQLSGGHSLKSVALATVKELKNMGLTEEAKKVEQTILQVKA